MSARVWCPPHATCNTLILVRLSTSLKMYIHTYICAYKRYIQHTATIQFSVPNTIDKGSLVDRAWGARAITAIIYMIKKLTEGVRDELWRRQPLADRARYSPRNTPVHRLSEPTSGRGHKLHGSRSPQVYWVSQYELWRKGGREGGRERRELELMYKYMSTIRPHNFVLTMAHFIGMEVDLECVASTTS